MYHNDSAANRRISVPPGLITIAAWVYSPRVLTGVVFETNFVRTDGSGTFIKGSTFTLQIGWQFVRSFVTVPTDRVAAGQSQILSTQQVNNRAEPGDVYYMGKAMIARGRYEGDYVDGDTPGWKWQGAAYASPSVGLPYTLDRLLGMGPSLVTTTKGTKFAVPGGRPDPYAGFSIYAVSDVLNPAGAIGGIVTFGSNPITGVGADNSVVMRSGSTTQNRWDNRPAALNGAASINGYGPGLRTLGRHIHSSICVFESVGPEGTHVFRAAADTQVSYNTRKTNDGGFTNQGFGIFATSGSEDPQMGMYFDRTHTEAERALVHQWLANRYGVPV